MEEASRKDALSRVRYSDDQRDPDASGVDTDDDDDTDDNISDADSEFVEQRAVSGKTLFKCKNEPALLDPKGNPFVWWRDRASTTLCYQWSLANG